MKPKLTVDFKFKLKIFINLKKIIKNMNLNQKLEQKIKKKIQNQKVWLAA